jgi:hypothetical protein
MKSRIKVLQIESIYPQYAKQIYDGRKDLESSSFEDQIQHILASGWSGGQNVIPYLNPSEWESHYIIPKLLPTQAAWARDFAGLKSGFNIRDVLGLQLLRYEPDVIYLSDISSFDFSLISSLRKRPLIIAWLATTPPNNVPWPMIDVLLSGIGAIRKEALFRGVSSAVEFNSAAPSYSKLNSTKGGKAETGATVGFSGSFYNKYHDTRASMLRRLAAKVTSVPVHIYTAQPDVFDNQPGIFVHDAVYASDVLATYSIHDLVVDGRADFGLGECRFHRDTSNMRIFEATRAGALLLTEYAPNLELMFDIPDEILCYKSEDELFDLVSFWCDERNTTARRKIAAAGFMKTLRCHTIETRALEFARIVKRFL